MQLLILNLRRDPVSRRCVAVTTFALNKAKRLKYILEHKSWRSKSYRPMNQCKFQLFNINRL